MNATALLAVLQDHGVTLFTDEGRLRYKADPGAYTMALRQAVAQHRAELLAILEAENAELVATAKEVFPVSLADLTPESMARSWAAHQRINAEYAANESRAWIDEEADTELRLAVETISAAEASTWLTQSQRNVLGVFRQQVHFYRQARDPQLVTVHPVLTIRRKRPNNRA